MEAPHAQDAVAEVSLRRSTRKRRSAISSDYGVYLGENDYDIGHVVDPVTFQETVYSDFSRSCFSPQKDLWMDAIRDEI